MTGKTVCEIQSADLAAAKDRMMIRCVLVQTGAAPFAHDFRFVEKTRSMFGSLVDLVNE